MKGSRLKNRFPKNRSKFNEIRFNKQRNLCFSFKKKKWDDYFSDLNEKDVTDNKQFWRTLKINYLKNIFS